MGRRLNPRARNINILRNNRSTKAGSLVVTLSRANTKAARLCIKVNSRISSPPPELTKAPILRLRALRGITDKQQRKICN
jgi:hypothetical protein